MTEFGRSMLILTLIISSLLREFSSDIIIPTQLVEHSGSCQRLKYPYTLIRLVFIQVNHKGQTLFHHHHQRSIPYGAHYVWRPGQP
ncbi:hypothetical protein EV421DRAFT_1787888 [Armillaria borealis]|uniref:Secreted protein n=1 Tax=Armillaria borealis TaxID=47425 RepID=A0AA39JW94_9AGAR|nr:hypothetical protein EV421DRAFT_1787888 [Armillaria borealis]